jgi:HlyD family secretion protein
VEVTIDAYRDTTFWGQVTKISHSAKLTPTETASGSTDRAVDFDVEITLKNPPPDIRPDLSCTARIITDTRDKALSIPIIALTVREHEKIPNESEAGGPAPPVDTLRARFKPKEAEGVFVVRNGVATFRPVKTGVAGDEYFEVLDGLREGETIVAGTYQAIRDLKDGTKVRQADTTKTKEARAS